MIKILSSDFMKNPLWFVLGFIAGAIICFLATTAFFPAAVTPVFSPGGGHDIIALIDGAQISLDIEMYVMTSQDVLLALERAEARGVAIRIILERDVIDSQNGEAYRELAAKGINVRYATDKYRLTHAKFMVVDGSAVLVGSHNFTGAALSDNREASVIIRDYAATASFSAVFAKDWALAS